jgi:hypothetical protein
LTCHPWPPKEVGLIGFSDHFYAAESLSTTGGSGCGLSPPATSLVSRGVSTTGCGNGDPSPVQFFAGILSIVDLLKAGGAVAPTTHALRQGTAYRLT